MFPAGKTCVFPIRHSPNSEAFSAAEWLSPFHKASLDAALERARAAGTCCGTAGVSFPAAFSDFLLVALLRKGLNEAVCPGLLSVPHPWRT